MYPAGFQTGDRPLDRRSGFVRGTSMMDVFALFAVLAAGQTAGGQAPGPPPPPPPAVKVGEQAPDFTLSYLGAEEGKVARKEVTLSSYRGKQNVVLAFFPAAFSPG